MEQLYSWVESNLAGFLLIILGFQMVIFGLGVVLWIRQSGQNQALRRLSGDTDWLNQILEQDQPKEQGFLRYLRRVDDRGRKLTGRMGLVRFNAVGERGADMSFSLALLNEEKDGVVISSLFSDQGKSYIYAKPIEKGSAHYRLSKEEQEAINRALKAVGKREEEGTGEEEAQPKNFESRIE